MSRGFIICMAKGGRGCLRPSYGRPKLTLFSRFVATKMSRCELKTLRQFCPINWKRFPVSTRNPCYCSFFSVLFDCFVACKDADQMEIEIGDWRKKGWAEEGRWICALIGKVGNAGTDRAGTGKCRNKSKPASNFYTRTHHFRGTKTPKTFHQKKKKNPLQRITTSTRS